MRNIFTGFLIGTLVAVSALVALPSATAWAASASGQAVVRAGDDALRILSFNAASVDQEEGTATGQIDFRDTQPYVNQDVDGTGDPALADAPNGVEMQANVDCLYVEGSRAVVGGQVTNASVPRYVGMWVLFVVYDGDTEDKPDKFSWGFYPEQTDMGCGTFPVGAYSEMMTIDSGDLQVQQ